MTVVEGLQVSLICFKQIRLGFDHGSSFHCFKQNAFGTLHGGATCTIIDVVGTLALLSLDQGRPGVSVELNTSFIAAAHANEMVRVVGSVLKVGKRLGFTQVDILGADGRLCATGRHTKAFSAQ